MGEELDTIDPKIICQICRDWHCITEYMPPCYPIERVLEPVCEEERSSDEDAPDFIEVDGHVYMRLSAVISTH